MPGEALQADSKAGAGSSGAGGVVMPSSAVPLRILNKGPEYFRRQADAHPKRLSAVERLEADKAKYVKSQEVINARQEPVKPPAASSSSPGPAPPGGPAHPQAHGPRRAGSSPALKASNNNAAGKSDSSCRPGNLNLELLKNLLNGGEALPRATGRKRSSRSWAPQRSEPAELHRRSFAESLRVFPSHGHGQGANLNLDRAGLLPRSRDPWLHVSHSSSDIRRISRRAAAAPAAGGSAPSLPPEPHATPPPAAGGLLVPEGGGACEAGGVAGGAGGGAKRPSLRRSKSDLSERHARAGADLERFFNQCGLDPDELERLGLQGLAGSDIVSSLNLHSASTAGSEPGGRGSRRSDDEEDEDDEDEEDEEEDLMDEEDEEDRVPYGISAVERNARVIKWLYSIRQNRESQRVSHV